MIWGLLFSLLFFSAAAYVLVKGDRLHRIAIGVMVLGVIATYLVYRNGSHKWLPLNISILTIDVLALLAFAWIAYRANRIWPLLLVAWQIATVTIHLASSFAEELLPKAYGIGQGIWAYLQLATIFIATFIERRRARHEHLEQR